MNNKKQHRKVAIYIRVSTSEQKIDGYGLEAQRQKLLEHVNENPALRLTTKEEWIFEDSHTGSDLVRPDLDRLLELVRTKTIDAVLVWKIDRLSRNLEHLIHLFSVLEKNDVSFISVQENIDFTGPIGKLVFNIFGAIAEFERELIRGRTNMGKIASAQMGNYTGTYIPYGYKKVTKKNVKGAKLEIIPEEKKWVKQVFRWYTWDGWGDLKIAKKLNELNIGLGEGSAHRRKNEAKWTPKRVEKIIKSEIYMGIFVANKKDEFGKLLPEDKWTIVEIPPCVSENVFLVAQDLRQERNGGGGANIYLLSRKLRDVSVSPSMGFCGAQRDRGGYSYRRQAFTRNGEKFSGFEIPAKQLEDFVWRKIVSALEKPEIFIKNYVAREKLDLERLELLKTELDNLRKEEEKLLKSSQNINEALIAGDFSRETFRKYIKKNDDDLKAIEKRETKIKEELIILESQDIEIKKLKEASQEFDFKLKNASRRQKRILCNLFVKRVELNRIHDAQGKKSMQVSANVILKFNPKKYLSPKEGVGTQKPYQIKDDRDLKLGKSESGRPGGS